MRARLVSAPSVPPYALGVPSTPATRVRRRPSPLDQDISQHWSAPFAMAPDSATFATAPLSIVASCATGLERYVTPRFCVAVVMNTPALFVLSGARFESLAF